MTVSVDELAASAFEVAKGIIEDSGEAQPCFLIQTETTIIPIVTVWRNDTERDAAFRNIHHSLLATQALSYALVSEGWTFPEPVDAKTWDGSRPRNAANRVECLSVTAYDRDGNGYNMMARIERLGSKRRRVGAPSIFVPGKDGESHGAAIDLFVPR